MKGDELFICRQVAGTLTLDQNSREVVLEAGDITLLDPGSPYVGKFSSGSKLLVLKVPMHDLEARVGNEPGASHDKRDRIWLGLYGCASFWPQIKNSLWFIAERLPPGCKAVSSTHASERPNVLTIALRAARENPAV